MLIWRVLVQENGKREARVLLLLSMLMFDVVDSGHDPGNVKN